MDGKLFQTMEDNIILKLFKTMIKTLGDNMSFNDKDNVPGIDIVASCLHKNIILTMIQNA